MKKTFQICRVLVVAILFCFLIGPLEGAQAQTGDSASQQEEMQKVLDMLKGQGMDEQTQKQMEQMFKNMSEMGAQQQASKLKKAQQKFAADTAGHGTAQVEVEGKQYELKMIECKIIDRRTAHFSMRARQSPGAGNGELWVRGGGGHSQSSIGFSHEKKDLYEESGNPTFQLNGKMLKWEGEVAMGNRKKVPLKFSLTCGAEMEDYATPSKPNPKSPANVLTLEMGKERHTFEAGLCSTKEYRTGNLIVEFESTATGMFRGRPAIVLISKSHPAESKQSFQNMDLLLGELTLEQRLLSPLNVAQQLQDTVSAYLKKETVAVGKVRDKEMAAFEKKYGNAPKGNVKEWSDAFNKLMDRQGKAMDKVQAHAKSMRYPKGRSFGAITVKGQEIHFGGSKLSTQDASRAPEFQDLPEKTELWVTCSN